MFPSPYGDIFLKSLNEESAEVVYKTEFPSPYGDIFLKFLVPKQFQGQNNFGFPSPYGDIFLKFGFLHPKRGAHRSVSVPLRGYFFEMHGLSAYRGSRSVFPSPYGDIFLKFTALARGYVSRRRFPSPYGDIFLK